MIEIKQYIPQNAQAVMDIWYETTVKDQAFIPQSFWFNVKDMVATDILPVARTWVAVNTTGKQEEIVGFISVLDTLVGALFIKLGHQSQGIGVQLLNSVTTIQTPLFVEVYQKNKRAHTFYEKYGFVDIEQLVQTETGEIVIRMQLQKNN